MDGGEEHTAAAWPDLPFEGWRDSLNTLHMWSQIVGKTKLALCPWLNQWWQIALVLDARGLTTGRMPYGDRSVQVDFDFVDHSLAIRDSLGGVEALPLVARPVAEFYKEYFEALAALGVSVEIDPLPVEVPDPIPFDVDVTHEAYDPDAASRFWRILASTERVLQRWRSPFVGKSSPVNFFWGSFDLNATRFSGKPAPLPVGAPRFLQLAEDQENVACGFWSGNATLSGFVYGAPAFYAYVYPEPAAFKEASVRPDAAAYHPQLGQFILPYDEARRAPDPDEAVLAFFTSAYEAAAETAGWDRASLEQPVPTFAPRRGRRRHIEATTP
ncbi:MAG TPA: DUF5996 family protein [Thermomicrobiales bacterium]|nr:DUF5996 family protein [Thermomicrobiales bacterium]